MQSRLEILIDLLHAHGEGALATHSAAVPGYPFASAVAFATDAHHRPLLLISSLAEHSRNLAADARASFLLARTLGQGEMARVSLVGEVRPVEAEPQLVRRYLRYHPAAERFLQLGDFRFQRFEPRRILVVGGFAQASWLEGKQLIDAASVALDVEEELLATAAKTLPGIDVLGIDAYGADVRDGGGRRRVSFAEGPLTADALPDALARELAP